MLPRNDVFGGQSNCSMDRTTQQVGGRDEDSGLMAKQQLLYPNIGRHQCKKHPYECTRRTMQMRCGVRRAQGLRRGMPRNEGLLVNDIVQQTMQRLAGVGRLLRRQLVLKGT